MMTHTKHNGVALITALLIVALATVAAVAVASEYRFGLRRAENTIFGGQAWAYVKGVETWSKLILSRDRSDNAIDHLNESWSVKLPPLPVPGGYVSGSIADEQGKMNVNNLVNGDEINEVARTRMQRLFALLELDEFLVDAIIDWIDVDLNTVSAEGAEDEYYTALDNAYLAANQPMAHISELRLVKGFNEGIYRKVLDHLTALPVQTAINVNTASAEVLASLSQEISLVMAEDVISERNTTPFETVQDFQQLNILAGIPINVQDLSVSSSYFTLLAESNVGKSRAHISSLAHRVDENNVRIMLRTQVN